MRLELAVLTLAFVCSAFGCGRLEYDPRDASSTADAAVDVWIDPTLDAFTLDAPRDDAGPLDTGVLDAGPPPCVVWSHGGTSMTGPSGAYAVAIDANTVYASVQPFGIDLGGGPLEDTIVARFDLSTGAWIGATPGSGDLIAHRGLVYVTDPMQSLARDGTYGPVIVGYDVAPSGRQVSQGAALEASDDFAWAAMPQTPYTLRGLVDPSTQDQDIAIATTASSGLYVLDEPGRQNVVDLEILEDGAVVWILQSSTMLTIDGVPFASTSRVLLWTAPDLDVTHAVMATTGQTLESVGGQRVVIAEQRAIVAYDVAPAGGSVTATEAWRVPADAPNNPDLFADADGGVTLAWSETSAEVIHIERRVVSTGSLDFERDVPATGRPALAMATRLTSTGYAVVLAGYSFPDAGLSLCGVPVSTGTGMGALFVARIQ